MRMRDIVTFVAGAAASGVIGTYAMRGVDTVGDVLSALRTGNLGVLDAKEQEPSGQLGGVDAFEVVSVSTELNPDVVAESDKWTDLSLFVCEGSATGADFAQALSALALERKYGSLKLVDIRPSEGLAQVIGGSVAVVYDASHGERDQMPELVSMLEGLEGAPPVTVLPNTGKQTPWRMSLFFCT